MTNRFLISVAAAALIAGTGLANAQGMGRDSGGSAGSPAAQQSAPSSDRGGPSSGGAMQRDSGGASGMKGAESGMKNDSGMTKGESGMKADSTDKAEPRSKSAQDGNRMQGEKSKSMSSDDSTKSSKEMKAEGRDSKTGTTTTESRDGKTGDTQTKGAASTDSKSQTTTGNAATSATAAPPAEKRTQIVSAIRSEKIQETTNVNFNISVGAVVPTSVRAYPLPPRIVEIYPEWRGYEVILVKGRYVIVRPQTHEIVYIIEG
jgi:hypothetical protein